MVWALYRGSGFRVSVQGLTVLGSFPGVDRKPVQG